MILTVMLYSTGARALGVGAAEVNSYIGERLEVSIPVFKVASPDSLIVNLKSTSVLYGIEAGINASIDRSNNQLSISIQSNTFINEPYLNFVIQVDDLENSLVKEFTVLLDLAPDAQQKNTAQTNIQNPALLTANIQSSGADRGTKTNGFQLTNAIEQSNYQQSNQASKTRPDRMGPYDWAQQNSIPVTFGAVLDGQSLWRVARRINTAMGVSIEQMMLALYHQNSHAFSSNSIDSLQAGSYLTIPEFDEVTQLSTEQAKQQIQQLSGAPISAAEAKILSGVTGTLPTIGTEETIPSEGEVLDPESIHSKTDVTENIETALTPQPAFRLSGLEQTPSSNDQNSIAGDNGSNKIITSLAVTVGNLTQDLIRKDKQIEFLQEKIAAMQSLQRLPAENELAAIGLNSALASNQPTPVASRNTLWLWALLAAGLAILAFLIRSRLRSIFQQLNLFGNQDEVEFAPTVLDVEGNSLNEYVNDRDYSVLSAAHIDMDEYEVEGVSLLELDDEQKLKSNNGSRIGKKNDDNIADYVVVPNVQVAKAGVGVVGMHSWQRKMDKLLTEKKYHEARTVLEAARHIEIDDDRYSYERLHLYIEMGEQAEFYKYYYEIEDKIARFDELLRDGIGNMIGSLAQQKA